MNAKLNDIKKYDMKKRIWRINLFDVLNLNFINIELFASFQK